MWELLSIICRQRAGDKQSSSTEAGSRANNRRTVTDVTKDGDSAFVDLSSLEDTDVNDQLVWKRPVRELQVMIQVIQILAFKIVTMHLGSFMAHNYTMSIVTSSSFFHACF